MNGKKQNSQTPFCRDFRQDYESIEKMSNKQNSQGLKLAKGYF